MPDWLVEDVHTLRDRASSIVLTAERVNADAPPHLRTCACCAGWRHTAQPSSCQTGMATQMANSPPDMHTTFSPLEPAKVPAS